MGDVQAGRKALVAGAFDDARLVAVATADEEIGLLVAAADAQAAVGDEALLAVNLVFVVEDFASGLGRFETRTFRSAELVFYLLSGKLTAAYLLDDGVEAQVLVEADVSTARGAFLGGNDDYPGVGTGTVDGGGGGPLQDFHALDVVGVDVRKAIGGTFLAATVGSGGVAGTTRDFHVGDVNTIDDDQRLVVARKRKI